MQVDWWVTPSGTTVSVPTGSEQTRSGFAGVHFELNVSSTGGDARVVTVYIDDLQFVNGCRRQNGLPPLDEEARATAAQVAAIKAVDDNPDFFASSEPLRVELGYDELDETRPKHPISNEALRRYVAQRLFLSWEHESFDQFLRFETMDESLTGAGPEAFLRNLQLLEQEGYVELSRTMGGGFPSFEARPTARLVRDVERYGAAAADVESEEDYVGRLVGTQDALAPDWDGIIAERRRYEVAQTPEEVVSVFRALVPILESVVRRLLQTHGSKRDPGTLGPMIGELQERQIGTRGLWTQLNAVQTNARDSSAHGEYVPLGVLRMATVGCFELFPQLGLLFPRPLD